MTPADELLREYGAELGVTDTFKPTRVGVFFGEAGREVSDPYFDGEGPPRTGCVRCGSCMVGCRHGAKNTLVKNYLWFAERLGARVLPERHATEIRPIGAPDGSGGYAVTSVRSGAWLRPERRTMTARGVVVAAGPLGTNQLLADFKHARALPRLSPRLGEVVRTNTESIQAVTAPDDSRDFSRSVAITSSIYPDLDTHIEVVTYGREADLMSTLFTALTGGGTGVTRPLKWIAAMLKHPLRTMRLLWPFKWSRRTVILLVMQSLDTAMRFRATPRPLGRGVRLQTEQDPDRPNPTYIPAAEAAARWFAQRTGGIPQSGLIELSSTSHHRAHTRRGGDRRGPVERGHRHRLPRVRLREPARVRRRRGAREPGRQPEPDDHRARRACDVTRPPEGGSGAGTNRASRGGARGVAELIPAHRQWAGERRLGGEGDGRVCMVEAPQSSQSIVVRQRDGHRRLYTPLSPHRPIRRGRLRRCGISPPPTQPPFVESVPSRSPR
jgi:hypothetical protein